MKGHVGIGIYIFSYCEYKFVLFMSYVYNELSKNLSDFSETFLDRLSIVSWRCTVLKM